MIDYRRQHVLFVENNVEIREWAGEHLAGEFTVTTASSGTEGRELLACSELSVLVVASDVPGIGGVELCLEAASLQPDAGRVLMTTARDHQQLHALIARGTVHRAIRKPFALHELIEAIRARIDASHIRTAMRPEPGLTMYFDRRLSTIDRQVIDALIVGLLGPATECRVALYSERGSGAVVRIEASSGQDLELVADALWERAWETTAVYKARAMHAEIERDAARRTLDELVRLRATQDMMSVLTASACDALGQIRDSLARIELRQRSDAVIEAEERRAREENDADIAKEAATFRTPLQKAGGAARRIVLSRIWGKAIDEVIEVARSQMR